jgi:ankyrin repeat protein/CII-binding regulator of phage lambda lysogenization HflD
MKINYTVTQRLIARLLLICLCLQSCGGGFDNNPFIPIQEEQTALIQTTVQVNLPLTNIQPLVDKQLTAHGGHAVNFYKKAGELKADVEMNAPQGFSKSYEGVKVYIEKGTELASLHRLDIKSQERRISLQLAQGKKPAHIVIYKGSGLMGGMLEGEEEASEGELEDEDIPEECFCPITQEIMQDPVIAQDGHTYERTAIQRWFDIPKRMSPKTGATLLNIKLRPNYAMRSLIQDLVPSLAKRKLEMRHIEAAIKLREEEITETLEQKGQLIEKENKEKLNLAASLEQKEKELEEKIDLVNVMEQRIKALEEQANSSKLREEEIAEKLVQKSHLVEKESQEKLHLATALEQRERELAERAAALNIMDDRIRELERQVRFFLEKDNKTHSIMLQIQQCMGQLSSEQFMSSSSGSSSSSSFIADSKDNTTVLAASQIKEKGKEKLKDEDSEIDEVVLLDQASRVEKEEIQLHKACEKGNLEAVKYLVEKGVNVNMENEERLTPLYYACQKGDLELVRYLVERGVNIQAKSKYGETPLYGACWRDNLELIKYLVEKGANIQAKSYGETPLATTARAGNLEAVKYLVGQGANVSVRDEEGNTPLHQACQKGDLELVKYLVEKGVNVNVKNINGNTPLLLACKGNDLELVKYLVEEGADVNAKDKEGNTLYWAYCERDNIELVKLLVELGADVNAKGDYGNTLLYFICERNDLELAKYLVDKGADVNVKDENGTTLLRFIYDEYENDNYLELFKYLVEKGADVNAKGKYGTNLLHFICESDNGNNNLELVKYLLEKGADINATDVMGETPIDIARQKGYKALVNLLNEKLDSY